MSDPTDKARVPGEEPADEPSDPVDEAFAAYLKSCDTGELSSREDFLKQFPEISVELRELMQAADLINSFTAGGPPSSAQSGVAENDAAAGHDAGDRRFELSGETVAMAPGEDEPSVADPAATLPMANRGKNDPGPTLPFDLGDYQLQKVLGRGGMGVVYLAKQKDLQRLVAVKMIRSGILAGEAEVRRFYTEAQAAARLHHPGIVAVYQFGRRAGHHFFSMEHIAGQDLQRRINQAPLDCEEAARVVRDGALAIAHAHQKGVLHRDLKPANVLIDADGGVHVTDFGLAKNVDADSSVTGSGAAVGTPHYMAPEQAGGHSDRATARSDVYSLGAILFACLTTRPPIVGDTVMQTLLKVVHDPAPPVRSVRDDVPVDLETVIAKCLEKSPAKRYAGAGKLAADLQAFLDGEPISARPRSVLVKSWHWIEGVPVIGAITGRRKFHTTDHHRRLQTAGLVLLMVLPLLVVATAWWRYHTQNTMPRRITIAGGLTGGVYTQISRQIALRLQASHPLEIDVVPTGGSVDNQKRLIAGELALAPMQASVVDGNRLCVVAPLFYELIHVLAKTDSGVEHIDDLAGHRVAVGPNDSGSRSAAEMVFDSMGIADDRVRRVVTPWPRLADPGAPDVAVVCIGRQSVLVTELLKSGDWTLIAIPEAERVGLEHPTLRSMTIMPDDYPDCGLPPGGIRTVGTTAFLAARFDTPDPLVTATLQALYASPLLVPGLIRQSQVAEWQGLSFHPAARRFFQTTP